MTWVKSYFRIKKATSAADWILKALFTTLVGFKRECLSSVHLFCAVVTNQEKRKGIMNSLSLSYLEGENRGRIYFLPSTKQTIR